MIKKTIIILGVCMIAFLVGTTFLVLNNNNPISEILKGNFLNEKTDYALVEQLKDDNLINELRTIDSSIQEGDLTKDYFALNKNVIIANDKETIIDLKLVSPYKVSGLIASPDTKVAEFYLSDWKIEKKDLIDSIKSFNLDKDYKEENKNFWYKYGTNVEDCFEGDCHTYTTWTRFDNLNELPNKNIKIGVFTNTRAGERVEWIPTIEGFEILEWAEYEVSTASYAGNLSTKATYGLDNHGHCFDPTGENLYVIHSGSNITQFSLAEAWNVTTASYVKGEALVGGTRGCATNGSRMLILILNGTIEQWTMTLNDVSTISRDAGKAVSRDSGTGSWFDIDVQVGGKIVRMIGDAGSGNMVIQYNCTDNWTADTCSLHADNLSFAVGGASYGLTSTPDGTKIMLANHIGNTSVYPFTMSTTGNLSTATYDATEYFTADLPSISAINFNDDGTRLYLGTYHGDKSVNQYTISSLIAPTPQLNIPANLTNSSTQSVLFNCSGNDEVEMHNVSLIINGSREYTESDTGVNNISLEQTIVLGEGTYNWTCNVTSATNERVQGEMRTLKVDSIAPVITITHPLNQTYTINFTELNYTYVELHKGNCWYSDDDEATVSAPSTMGDNFTIALKEGSTNLTVICNDSTFNNIGRSSVQIFLDSIVPDVKIIFPINNTNHSINTLDINYTRDITDVNTCWYSNDSYTSITILPSCENVTNVIWAEGKHNVTVWVNDSSGGQNSSNITFGIDTITPLVNITYPINLVTHHRKNNNLTINWSITDTNLEECLGSFDNWTTNISLTCADNNITVNITSSTNNTFYLWANDTVNNGAFNVSVWDYKVFEQNQTFNINTTEGNLEDFSSVVTLSGVTISQADFYYNETSYSGVISELTNQTILSKENLVVPNIAATTNFTFYWELILSDGSKVNLTKQNQTTYNLSIDDCTAFADIILNFTVYHEELQTNLSNTTVEIALNIFSSDRTTEIMNLSSSYDSNPVLICMNRNLTSSSNYSLDAIIKYEAIGYATEYYNIVNLEMTNSTPAQEIWLYDLNSTDSTEFKITFTGENFVPVKDALIYIDRRYIAEDVYKTVELPKTDINGETIGHFVRNDIIYNIRVIKGGVVLGDFREVRAFCDDATIGDCQIRLEPTGENATFFDYNEEVGIIFESIPAYNNVTNIVSMSFTSPDGTPKTVTMQVNRNDIFGNRSLCNQTLVSASGTLSCNVGAGIDETTIEIEVMAEGVQAGVFSLNLEGLDYGDIGFIFWFIFTFCLIMILGSDKTTILFSLIISYIGAVAMGVVKGGIVGIGSAGIWLIVITILGIWKLNKERAQ